MLLGHGGGDAKTNGVFIVEVVTGVDLDEPPKKVTRLVSSMT